MKTSRGFASLIIILAIVGLIVLGGAGYFATHKIGFPGTTASSNESAYVAFKPVAPGILLSTTPDVDPAHVPGDWERVRITYFHHGSSVYYFRGTVHALPDADYETFETLSGSITDSDPLALDKNAVYYAGQKIEGADPATFHMVGGFPGTVEDSHTAYRCADTCAITGTSSDAATATTTAALFTKDDQNVYCAGQLLVGADPRTAVIAANSLTVVINQVVKVFDTNCDAYTSVAEGQASIAPIPQVIDMAQQAPYDAPTGNGRLFLYSGGTQLIPMSGLSEGVARHVCFESGVDRCLFDGGELKPDSSPVPYGLQILAPTGNVVITRGYQTIKIHDDGPAGEYHIYLKHFGSNGMDRVYEAHLTKIAGDNPYELSWDTRAVTLAGSTLTFSSLPQGIYLLAVVNANLASGAEIFVTVGNTAAGSYIKPYAEGTPFYTDSSWDGRGIFMDGGGGIDTLQLAGDQSEYQIYRGKDMPGKNQYNTIVLRQNVSGTIIVATNDEILKFDDITLSIPALTPIAR